MKKLTKKDIMVFDGTVRGALKACLDAGYIPTTLSETNQLLRDNILDRDKFHDTRTTNFQYGLRDLSLKEMKDIDNFYDIGGRVLFVGGSLNFGTLYSLLNFGRFVGVRRKK